jgi:DUF4097 and DUF4098 domain-containing protein YvlB
MKRQSVVGPILLILIGVLFLTRNLWERIPLFDLLAHYWPFLLIGWGLLRLVEVAVLAMSGKPLTTGRLTGGEIMLIILLCLIGSGMMAANRSGFRIPRIGASGIEIFGQQYDYDKTDQKAAPDAVHVVFDNLRGNVRVTGSDQPQVRVEQHKTVRAMQKSEADQVDRDTPLEMISEGDRIVIRTNQERVSSRRRIAADLEVTVPRGASIEARATYGDFDITGVAGTVDINSANAGVRLNKIGGNVKIDLGRSDIIRAVGVKGAVDLQGRGSDIDLEDMTGQITINGSYSGTLQFKNLAKPLHFESRQTDLRVAQIPGSITMDLGDFTANNLVGPIRLVTRSRDIRIEDFTQSLELESERGDIELRPGKSPLPKIDARGRNGKIDLILPESAQFDLTLTTNRGEAHNEFGPAIKVETEGQSSTLKGSVGKGPAIRISTERGSVSVKKG